MKFCKDCRFVEFVPGLNSPLAKCRYSPPPGSKVDLVTGERVPETLRWEFCSALRTGPAQPDTCGEEGQFFQARAEQVAA